MSVVIHIGLHKTGTKTLQHLVFPRLPDCTSLVPVSNRLYRFLTNNLIDADEREYLQETLRSFFDEVRAGAQNMVVSREGFSGDPFVPREGHLHRERNLERLHTLFPNAQILLVVRDQRTMLRSLYSQYVQKGGPEKFVDFASRPLPGCHLNLDHLRYDELVAACQDVFGASAVKVMLYERLVRRSEDFFAELMSFIVPEAPFRADDFPIARVHRSLSPAMRSVLRHSNRLVRRSNLNPQPTLRHVRSARRLRHSLARVDDVLFPEASRDFQRREERLLMQRLLQAYEPSNARLETMTGLSLREYGYPLPRQRLPS